MNNLDRSAAYGLIRVGAGFVGIAIIVAYSPILLAGLSRWFFPLGFIASIPLAFFVGGQGLAMIVDGIAHIFRS